MTRDEHLEWCKNRAMEYWHKGDLNNAVASMGSDLEKHEGTKGVNSALVMLGMMCVMQHDREGCRRWIEGFR